MKSSKQTRQVFLYSLMGVAALGLAFYLSKNQLSLSSKAYSEIPSICYPILSAKKPVMLTVTETLAVETIKNKKRHVTRHVTKLLGQSCQNV
ncbi:MAG: hypothetical protein KatS3mg088_657 [Patescibacteria group bacterium]|nr:MAG: hypothetical protein KatS3mg088_657 [Patescibacteria group bacterium]